MSGPTRRVPGHRIAWWVWAFGPPGAGLAPVKMRHRATMRGTWGWDATCSCGWESRTGGATRGSIERLGIARHMWDVADDAGRDALLGIDR